MTTKTKSNKIRLNAAGWLAVAVLAVLAISVGGLLIRPLTSQPIAAASLVTAQPTWTPFPTVTSAPSATPLPAGWTQQQGLNGQMEFVPPDADQQAIKGAFAALIACNYSEDASDEELRAQPDKTALCDKAKQSAAPEFAALVSLSNVREIVKLGPVIPARCSSTNVCTISRAKLGIVGAMGYDDTTCGTRHKDRPCIYRGAAGEGTTPYLIFIATVTREEDGTWKVTGTKIEKLPGPPPSQ